MSGGVTIVNGRGVNVCVNGAEVTINGQAAVLVPRRLRGRVEAWAKRHGLPVADALARLVEKGLDADDG